jgi:purine/pyrimidine-nucleoside phosphorylase
MININEYFDGKVKSLALENTDGKATIGVMDPGDYEFGTSTIEFMTVVSGEMSVLLPGEIEWQSFKPFQTFMVPKDAKFKLHIEEASAYRCIYK